VCDLLFCQKSKSHTTQGAASKALGILATRGYDSLPGQGSDVQDGGPDVPGPPGRQEFLAEVGRTTIGLQNFVSFAEAGAHHAILCRQDPPKVFAERAGRKSLDHDG